MNSQNKLNIKETMQKLQDLPINQMFKMASNDDTELNPLLSYNRDRLNNFDRERNEWFEKYQKVNISQSELHKIEWELKKRFEEIAELQRIITQFKTNLFDERQQKLSQHKEMEFLRQKQIEDNKKIHYLQSITQPIEEQVILQKDQKPIINHKFTKNEPQNSGSNTKENQISSQCQGRALIKTIHLPSDKLNEAEQENQILKENFGQLQDLCSKEFQLLKEQLRLKQEDQKINENKEYEEINNFVKQNQKFEKDMIALTKDFFAFKLKSNDQLRQQEEEKELLRLKNIALASKLLNLQNNAQIENDAQRKLADRQTEEQVGNFRNQLKTQNESITIIKNQFAQQQKIYLGKIKELEDNLAKLAEKYSKLEQRRKLEVQGFKNQNKIIKQRIESLSFQESETQQEDLRVKRSQLGQSSEKKSSQKENSEAIKSQKKKQLQQIYGINRSGKKSNQKLSQSQQDDEEIKQQEDLEKNQENSEQQQEQEHQKEEEDNESDTMRSQDIDNLNKQLLELEQQMDVAKKN